MAAHTHSAIAHHGPKDPPKTFTMVLVALLILTVITVAASRIDFGTLNVILALGIATVKASLVALYFMHLRYDKPINAIFFVSSLGFVGLLLIFSLTDVETRWHTEPKNLKVTPAGAAPGAQPPAPGATPAADQPAEPPPAAQ